jgi:hypothetical protein
VPVNRLFRLTSLGVALFGAVALIALPAPLPASAVSGCGMIMSGGAHVHVRVLRGDVACRRARRVLRTYLSSKRPCSGSSCVRKHDGFTCQLAPAFAFPRLASCWHWRARIAAYSTAD